MDLAIPRPARRRALPLLLGGLLPLAACDGGPALPASDLRVVYTASLNGYIEPCGCVIGKTGGIDRLAARVERHRAEHPNVLFLEAGDLFAEDPSVDTMLGRQLVHKADALLEVWSDLGCRAMALGDLDLVLGVDELQRLSAEHGVPILCANLEAPDGSRPFEPWVVFEQGDLTVGVFALLGPSMEAAGPVDERVFDVERTVADLGFRLTDWRTAAERAVAELRPRVDLLIALSHLGARRNAQLADAHPELDLISGGHEDGIEEPLRFVDGVPITSSSIRGGRLNRVDLWFDGRPPRPSDAGAGGPRREWGDVSDRVRAFTDLATAQQALVMLDGRAGTLGEDEWGGRVNGARDSIKTIGDALSRPLPFPSGPQLAFVGELMSMSAERSERALAAIDGYHDALYGMWAAEERESPHPTDLYVGPRSCYECHDAQYEFWKTTSHSHAFETLRATQQHVDVECIQCHTVGFKSPQGFRFPAQSAGFEDVQCAACHGPGGLHVAGGASYADSHLVETPAQTCFLCHNKDHAPDFPKEYAEALPRVSCPPMGAGSPELNLARLEAAEALQGRQGEDRERAVALFVAAGDDERAYASAQDWLEGDPRSVEARLVVGELALNRGENELASQYGRSVTRRRPNLLRGWKLEAGAALALGELERASIAIREATSIAPLDAQVAVLAARTAHAAGDLEAAIDVLRVTLERAPAAAPLLEPWLELFLAERG